MFFKIGVFKFFFFFTIFAGKHLCQSYFLITLQAWRPAILLKRDSAQVFSCEYWEIFKSTYFEEHQQIVASVLLIIKLVISIGHLY